ncbi:hypothetical protein JD844_026482, partial [Phrynosoma platyrhinos]
ISLLISVPLQINEDNQEDNQERDDPEEGEVKAEDDIYVMMMRSESPCSGLGTREHPGAFMKIEKNRGMSNEAEQKDDEGERVAEKEASTEEEGNKFEDNLHRLGGNDEKHNIATKKVSQSHDRDVNYAERPPLPPRLQPITTRQDEFPYLSPGTHM